MLLSAFPETYDRDITVKIMEAIAQQPSLWREYCNVETDPRAVIKLTNYSGFGQIGEWKDGIPLPMDEALKIGDQTLTMVFFGGGFKVTRKHVRYGDLRIINGWVQKLGRSVGQTYNVTHAALLNNAFTTTHSHFGTKTLIATDHTTSGSGTRANRPATDAALTPANLEAVYILGLNWIDYRGLNDSYAATKLIVPTALRRMAVKVTQSENEPSTTDNDINTHRNLFTPLVIPELTSACS
jgi:phage major head subunit gpT-like protein